MVEFSSSLALFMLWAASASAGGLWSYGAAFVVLVGVIVESIAGLTEWIKPEKLRKKVEKAGALVLILGLTGDLIGIRMSQLEIASLNLKAGTANELAAREQRARTAMLAQLQPRDFSKEQMEDFVASIKGKVADLNVFTLPDPEASEFGFAVMAGLQRAGVKVSWYPTTSPYFLVPGVSSTGLTIWDDPTKRVSGTLADAFLEAGQSSVGVFQDRPAGQDRPGVVSPSSIPVPALFIALKQPAFVRFPEWGGGAIRLPRPRKPPWEQ
jgi:hypothetical protein